MQLTNKIERSAIIIRATTRSAIGGGKGRRLARKTRSVAQIVVKLAAPWAKNAKLVEIGYPSIALHVVNYVLAIEFLAFSSQLPR